MNLTVPVGKAGASAARWKGAFLGMAEEVSVKTGIIMETGTVQSFRNPVKSLE
ncbi:MAG: hypothetical protein ACXWFX_17505 [Methylobacter sp.]